MEGGGFGFGHRVGEDASSSNAAPLLRRSPFRLQTLLHHRLCPVPQRGLLTRPEASASLRCPHTLPERCENLRHPLGGLLVPEVKRVSVLFEFVVSFDLFVRFGRKNVELKPSVIARGQLTGGSVAKCNAIQKNVDLKSRNSQGKGENLLGSTGLSSILSKA